MSDWVRTQWDYFVITPPTDTPISLSEAKTFLRIDTDDDDALITSLIEAATECGQKLSNRIFVTTEFRTFRNGFGERRDFTSGGKRPLVLRRSPFISTTLFTYKNDTTIVTLVKDTDYFEEVVSDYSKLRPEDFWPSDNKRRVQSLTVEFNAGYGAPTDVPADLKNALLQHVSFLYENRGDCGCDQQSAIASGAMVIYNKYRIIEV